MPSDYDAPQPLVVRVARGSSAGDFAPMSHRSFKPEDLCVLGSALRVRPLPLCPELSLWLLHDGVDLNARADELLRAAGRQPGDVHGLESRTADETVPP